MFSKAFFLRVIKSRDCVGSVNMSVHRCDDLSVKLLFFNYKFSLIFLPVDKFMIFINT